MIQWLAQPQPVAAWRLPTVAIVAAGPEIVGGQGVEASLLVEALIDDGHSVLFVPINAPLPAGLRWLRGIRYLRTVANQVAYWPSLWPVTRADVVHVFSASYWSFLLAPVPAMLVARLAGRRVILHYHSGEADDHLARWGWLVHPWLKLAHEVVVPSEFLRDVFARHGHRVSVIANIVDVSSFRYRERRPLAPRLLSARSLEPPYGVDVTIAAFARIKVRYPDATLTVAGAGSHENALREIVARTRLTGVHFVGCVKPIDMPGLYGSADIFMNASRIDNQPVSILEAFAAGVVVVTTAVGDIPAMVRDHETGRLVPAADPDALAEAAIELLEDPEHAVALTTRAKRELGSHTWPAVREAWRNAYAGPAALGGVMPRT